MKLHNSKIIYITEIFAGFAVISRTVKSTATRYSKCLDKVICMSIGKILALRGAPAVCGFIHPMGELLECIP